MRQTAFLVLNSIVVDNFAALFDCTPAGLNDGPWPKNFQLSWAGLDALYLGGPTGVQLLDVCFSNVSVLVLLLSTQLISCQC